MHCGPHDGMLPQTRLLFGCGDVDLSLSPHLDHRMSILRVRYLRFRESDPVIFQVKNGRAKLLSATRAPISSNAV
jgi:hypothetical protein